MHISLVITYQNALLKVHVSVVMCTAYLLNVVCVKGWSGRFTDVVNYYRFYIKSSYV